ncbi:UNVERIFIED_CONTAM: hypothetical protein HHA_313760 [Hammondia hammondi]|eukprot:XP_008883544.1 hypothetical protein HHA_313760 [Hammondia hammondi]
MASAESLLPGEDGSRERDMLPPPGVTVEMGFLSSQQSGRQRDEVNPSTSPDAGLNDVAISPTANPERAGRLSADLSPHFLSSSSPLRSSSGAASQSPPPPSGASAISQPTPGPLRGMLSRGLRGQAGQREQGEQREQGARGGTWIPLSPLDQEAMNATMGGISKFSGLRSLLILVFGLLPLLLEIQLLLPSLTGHLDAVTWVYVQQLLNAEELTSSIIFPLSTAQVSFAAQQARRRAQKPRREVPLVGGGEETRDAVGATRMKHVDLPKGEEAGEELGPFPVLLVPQYDKHDSEGSLFQQLRTWHLSRRKGAEEKGQDEREDDEQKPRKRVALSALTPPAPSLSSKDNEALSSFPPSSTRTPAAQVSAIFPLAIGAAKCAACNEYFQPGVLPGSVTASSVSSSSFTAEVSPGSPMSEDAGGGAAEGAEEAAGQAEPQTRRSAPPSPTSTEPASAAGEVALKEAASYEPEGSRGDRGSEDKRRLRLSLVTRQHSFSPPATSPTPSSELPQGNSQHSSASSTPLSNPVATSFSNSSNFFSASSSASSLSAPRDHGPTVFFWVDSENYDVTPPILLVYASFVVMMIRWFVLAVRALGEALLLQDDLDPAGAVLSPAAVSKPLRVVAAFSIWSLGFCIFPYSLSATQGCMAGDMDGTNIPVSVFYTYFQYSIWTALILALVARRLSKFFKRRAVAVEAEARRGREAFRMQAPETPSVSTPPVAVSPGGPARTFLSSSSPLDPSHSPVSFPGVGEGTTTPSNLHAGAPSPSASVAPPVVDNFGRTEEELQDFDDDGSSSASSSLPSSAEQSFIQESDARRASDDRFSTRHGEERRSERRRTTGFTNAALLLMGYRMLIQRLCRRPHTMWGLLTWRRDTLFASRYHAYQEMCSMAAFLLSAHTVSGALVVLLGPIQPWMKAVWLHIACMFIEAVARIQIAKGEERVQNARQVAINPDFFAAGTRRPISNVGVGARASAAAGGTPWGYAFVEEPRDRLLLKQLSSTYFSIAERIVDQVTASVAVASSSCCCFPSSVSSPVPSSLESGSGHELTIPLRSRHEESSPPLLPASTSSSAPSPSFGDRRSSSNSALPAASEEERGSLSSSPSPSSRDSSQREAPSVPFVKASEEDTRLVCANRCEALGPTEESSYAFAEAARHSRSWRQAREKAREEAHEEAHECPHRGNDTERRRRIEMRVRTAEREKGSNPETTDMLEGKADGRSTPYVSRRRKWGGEKVETEDEVTGTGRDSKGRSWRNLKRQRKCISAAHNETHTGSEEETSSQLAKGARISEGDQGRNTEDDRVGSVLGGQFHERGHDASNDKRGRRANALFLDSASAFSCSENGDRVPYPLPGSCEESIPSCGSGNLGLPSSSPSTCDPSSALVAFGFSSPRVLPPSSSSSPVAFLVPSSSVDDPAVARSLPAASAAPCDTSSASSSGSASALSFSACEICAEAAANAILLPCGHGGCCEACARLVVEKEHQRARSQSVTWLREWLGHPSASFLLPFSSRQPGVSSASAGEETRVGDRRSEEQARDVAMMQLPRCPFCRQAVERIVKIDGTCGDDRGYIAAHTVAVVTVGTQAERSRRATARLLR